MRRPLVGIALFFILGILFAKLINISFIIIFIATIISFLCALLYLKFNLKFKYIILVSFFLLGACLFKNSQKIDSSHIEKYIGYKGRAVALLGIVDSDPEIRNFNYRKKTSFIFKLKEIKYFDKWQPTFGKVLVNSFQNREFTYGQELILEGKIYKAPKFAITPKFDYREYLRRKQIFGILSVKRNSPVEIISENSANPIKALSLKIRNKLSKQIDSYLPPVESSLLRAILLGERREIPAYINDAFIQTGTIHILAISGMNIGFIAFIILIFLKVVGLPRSFRYILTIIFLFLYVFMTGSPVSVIRATIMFIIFLSGFLFERESDICNSLALSSLLILGFNPNQLFDIGFQLSFVSLISIVTLSPKIEGYIYKIFPKKTKILSFFWSSNAVSLAAWLGVLGIIVYNFNIITPLAILANLFIVPFMIIVSALGLIFVLVSLIFPALAFIFANSASASLFILVKFTCFLSKLPGAYFYTPSLPLYLVIIYYFLFLSLFNLPNLMSIFNYFRNRE